MDKKVKIGVLGAGRGMTMMRYCQHAENAELVAVCDYSEKSLSNAKKEMNCSSIAYYSDFEQFIRHDMDAVVLANYANEHAPYAVKCMKAGLHVISEVLPVQTMKEAVELIETVEETGMVYAYAENYCYMPAPREMKRLYSEGKIGTFEYGEGEYMHNCEKDWYALTNGGDPKHWRNTMYATFYCTHSIGPLIHISRLRPVSVVAFEMPVNERMVRMGAKCGHSALEIVTLENGAIFKSLHGVGCSRNSSWYSVYGSEGRLESAREDADNGGNARIYVNCSSTDIYQIQTYEPRDDKSGMAEYFGHGSADYYTMYNFVEKLKGNPEADTIDVYEAMDMFLPGMMGYQSILQGNVSIAIPDLRDINVREQYRNHRA